MHISLSQEKDGFEGATIAIKLMVLLHPSREFKCHQDYCKFVTQERFAL
jgi:hypothetical protein